MTTKAKSKTANLPVAIEQTLNEERKSLAKRLQQGGGSKIKVLKTKHFEFPGGAKTPGPLHVVIVDFTSVNQYFDKEFNDAKASAPACFAMGDIIEEMVPLKESPSRQSDDCASCEQNQWGSGKTEKSKACKNMRRLAVVAGEGDQAADPTSPMYILDVSPTALSAFDKYVRALDSTEGKQPIQVITDVFFHPGVDHQSLRFGNPRPNPNLALHFGRRAEAKALLSRTPDFSNYVPPKAKGRK